MRLLHAFAVLCAFGLHTKSQSQSLPAGSSSVLTLFDSLASSGDAEFTAGVTRHHNLLLNDEAYGFEWEVVQEHDSGELSGMVTSRLYFTMANPLDYLSAVGGYVDEPWIMESTSSPAWFNNSQGHPFAHYSANPGVAGIEPGLFSANPSLQFDSWVTIGSSDVTEEPLVDAIWGLNSPNDAMGSLPGVNFAIDDEVGGAIYCAFPGVQAASEGHRAFAGDDLRVLVGQFTTSGQITGQAFLQVFANADQSQEFRGVFVIPPSPYQVPGCTLEFACNYNPEAVFDDGSCEFICPGCTDESACNYDSGAIQDDGSCTYPEDLGFCDCEGNQLDAVGICGGSCAEDMDEDGICDDVDECIGAFDECGICQGPGAIYACGCADAPEGFCDCEGNVLDECGVCGGSGIPEGDCDCVGNVLDECGVCGGMGIPEGECDCNGNVVDECGVCGGDGSTLDECGV